MDEKSTDSEVELTIDETEHAAKRGKRKLSNKKGKKAKGVIKGRLKIKLEKPKVTKQQTKPQNIRISSRVRKPRNLSPEPPLENIKLRIKKSILDKEKAKKNSKNKTKNNLNSQNKAIDIEKLSDDDIPEVPVLSIKPDHLESNPIKSFKEKNDGIKLRLSLGKVITQTLQLKTKECNVDTIKNEPATAVVANLETRTVQPIKIKRTISAIGETNTIDNTTNSSNATPTKNDHDSLTMKFSGKKIEFVDSPASSSLLWTVSSKKQCHNKTHGASSMFNTSADFRFSSKRTISSENQTIADSDKNTSPTVNSSKLHISSSSVLKIPNEISAPQRMLFNSRFQSLLDTVSAEIKEQEKMEAAVKNEAAESTVNTEADDSHLPSVEFPKQKIAFPTHKRSKKKSTGTTATLMKIKASVDVLETSQISNDESGTDTLPEKNRRKILKRKHLDDDYVDPDSVPICISDEKVVKTPVKNKNISINNVSVKPAFNSLLMPNYWTDANDMKAKLTKEFGNINSNTQDKKAAKTPMRHKKGLATTKQRLASKLKLSTKRGYVL